MSYIPDCRTDEYYNEKYLNDNDKAEVRGYDWAVEEVVDTAFDNLDVFCDDTFLAELNKPLPESLKTEYEMEWRFGDRGTEKRNVETYLDLLRYAILAHCEMDRNELVTSMIDDMDEDEYKAIKEKVDGRVEERDGQATGADGAKDC